MTRRRLLIEWIRGLERWASAQPEIAELWVYGSRVSGRSHNDSDLDIAVLLSPLPELDKLIERKSVWRAELSKLLPVNFDLDIMNDDFLGADILEEIKKHGRLISRRPG